MGRAWVAEQEAAESAKPMESTDGLAGSKDLMLRGFAVHIIYVIILNLNKFVEIIIIIIIIFKLGIDLHKRFDAVV